ncbi:MAG: DUF3450 domain-containing protein [Lysobacteraceae bacterium]|nr:MAG: DUF3450 domain-containing protein [Xanthomonadaceae bacterium]
MPLDFVFCGQHQKVEQAMPVKILPSRVALVPAAMLATMVALPLQAQILDTTVQAEVQINEDAARSQTNVDTLSDQTEELLSEYRAVLRETESLQVYNTQLERVVANQRLEMDSIETQLGELEDTNRGVVPLLIEMIDMLGQIVENDLPFQLEERLERVATLEDLIDRADITTSEKYRRVMEAYQVEMEYGRNPYAYQDQLPGTTRQVNFLRVGRTLLLYQTLDGETTGWYNPMSRTFEQLGDEYGSSVTQALRIARNQAAPDLVRLPVVAAEPAQ